MRIVKALLIAVAVSMFWVVADHAQSSPSTTFLSADGFQVSPSGPWQPLPGPTPFYPDTALLLTDGRVLAQDYGTPNWWTLTPDQYGNYFNGTWTQMASMPNAYAPYDYCSAVLADGRVVVLGGEYTYDANGNATGTETNQGAIYDPVQNSWSTIAPPPDPSAPTGVWTHIGDASCTVAPNGKLLLARNSSSFRGEVGTAGQVAALDPATLTWTVFSPPGKNGGNGEDNWTLLPDGSLLAVDVGSFVPKAERFLAPWLTGTPEGEWISAGSTPYPVGLARGSEMGPQVLRPDGTVFAVGATGANAVYQPPSSLFGTGTWLSAPRFPTSPVTGQQLDMCDGVGILLTSGNVLTGASPGCYNIDDYFYEFDGTNLNPVMRPSFGPYISSFWDRLLMLPTGQALVTYDNNDAELYTSAGAPNASWAPAIASAPHNVKPGRTYSLTGTQFNGLSQGNNYGDDEAASTNYPLVRLTNHVSCRVTYARTHDHSTMAVATGNALVSTNFDVPAQIDPGPSELVVVTNGIASQPVTVVVEGSSATTEPLGPPPTGCPIK